MRGAAVVEDGVPAGPRHEGQRIPVAIPADQAADSHLVQRVHRAPPPLLTSIQYRSPADRISAPFSSSEDLSEHLHVRRQRPGRPHADPLPDPPGLLCFVLKHVLVPRADRLLRLLDLPPLPHPVTVHAGVALVGAPAEALSDVLLRLDPNLPAFRPPGRRGQVAEKLLVPRQGDPAMLEVLAELPPHLSAQVRVLSLV